MPLIVVTGKPSSGKSTLTGRIRKFIERRKPGQIEVISDGISAVFSRSIYSDSYKEREHRGILRSEVQRLLSKERLVLCDSLNYIKGFRYELFCIAKMLQTTYCVVYCDASEDSCWWLNQQKDEVERYETDVMAKLMMRFEEPFATNRWDSLLFEVKIRIGDVTNGMCGTSSEQHMCFCGPNDAAVPLDEIYSCLFEGKVLPANQSTQIVSAMPANFLHVIDRVTQEIISSIIQQQQNALPGNSFIVPNCNVENNKLSDFEVLFVRRRSVAELSRLRRQFISYMKMHPIKGISDSASLFVNYLNEHY